MERMYTITNEIDEYLMGEGYELTGNTHLVRLDSGEFESFRVMRRYIEGSRSDFYVDVSRDRVEMYGYDVDMTEWVSEGMFKVSDEVVGSVEAFIRFLTDVFDEVGV